MHARTQVHWHGAVLYRPPDTILDRHQCVLLHVCMHVCVCVQVLVLAVLTTAAVVPTLELGATRTEQDPFDSKSLNQNAVLVVFFAHN